jgi:hypothetical protein
MMKLNLDVVCIADRDYRARSTPAHGQGYTIDRRLLPVSKLKALRVRRNDEALQWLTATHMGSSK